MHFVLVLLLILFFLFLIHGKSITLPSNYVYDMLYQNNGQWIITFITVWWWYRLGGWVVYDIVDKLIALQTGDVEEVQKNNIKKEML